MTRRPGAATRTAADHAMVALLFAVLLVPWATAIAVIGVALTRGP
ncbi:hypothetical protein AB0N73_14065 [Microbacterium sp. NPDC089189]